jgi:DNA-binding transcriptional ArsR family regulator
MITSPAPSATMLAPSRRPVPLSACPPRWRSFCRRRDIMCDTYLEGGILLHTSLTEAPFQFSEAPTKPELLGKYFRVLSVPARLRILEALDDARELSVGELVERVGLPQPSVSNHLACLRWCGFVATRRDHRTVYNRIADPRVSELTAIARSLLEDNAEHVAACERI